MLKRGFGALALTAFAFLIIWGTWKADKPVSESARKLMIRQAAAFEPVPELPPAPITTASIPGAPTAAAAAAPAPSPDQMLESDGARQSWPITGRSHRDVRPATA